MGKTVGVILSLKDKCSPQLNKIADKLGMTTKEAKRSAQACKRLGEKMNKGLSQACKACKIGLVGIGAGMIALAKEGLKTAGSMEKYKVSFDTMLGSQEKSNALMKDIVKYAGTTPYKLDDVVKGTQRLLAFGIESENVIDRMGRLGDLSKGDSAILDRLTLAFGKIKAKGKASLEELNQLTEAGVPIMDALAKSQNKTSKEMFELVSKGKIGYKEVEQAVISLTSKGGQYYQMTLKQSKTLDGVLSTLGDSWNLGIAGIVEESLPQIKRFASELIDNMPKIMNAIKPLMTITMKGITLISNLVLLIAKYSDVLIPVATGIMAITTGIGVLNTVLKITNLIIATGPIGRAVVIITAVITSITALVNWIKILKKEGKGIKDILPWNKEKENNTTPTIPKYATGTSYASGGVSLVGEHGAELVDLPRGSKVTSASQTREKLGRDVVVNVNIAGNVVGNNEFITQIKQVLGLELQRALIG